MAFKRFKHVCGVLRTGLDTTSMTVVVAGGKDQYDNIISSVETIMVTETSGDNIFLFAEGWEPGPSLPVPLADAASIITSDQRSLVVIGGDGIDGTSDKIFKLSCSANSLNIESESLQCSWTKVDFELQISSKSAVAIAVPRIPMVPIEYLNGRDCTKSMSNKYLL